MPILQKMLVAYDGSTNAQKAFDFALELARLCRGEVRELHVLSVVQLPEPADLVEVDAIIDAGNRQFEELHAKLVAQAKDASVEIVTAVAVGHPAEQIAHYAGDKGCDLVLLGRRGKSRMEEWIIGSVSKRVTTYAPCNVVIVK